MNNETGQRLTEAIWALTNELRKQAEQGPSQNGAAPFTSGDAVTVTNPRSEWYGATGTVENTSPTHMLVRYHGTHTAWTKNEYLTKGESK